MQCMGEGPQHAPGCVGNGHRSHTALLQSKSSGSGRRATLHQTCAARRWSQYRGGHVRRCHVRANDPPYHPLPSRPRLSSPDRLARSGR
eukprot:10734897-Heterocapsa_arctica.AAC.4